MLIVTATAANASLSDAIAIEAVSQSFCVGHVFPLIAAPIHTVYWPIVSMFCWHDKLIYLYDRLTVYKSKPIYKTRFQTFLIKRSALCC